MLSLYVSDRSFTKSHFSQFTSLQVLELTETVFQKHYPQPPYTNSDFFDKIKENARSRVLNIKEVAEKAGVSITTVSRVLNNPEMVSEKTKNKVLTVMDQLNYTPNWFARHLQKSRTNVIGMLIPDTLEQSYMEITKGVEKIARQKNCSIILCSTEFDPDMEADYITTLTERSIDGLILTSPSIDRKQFDRLKSRDVPFVFIGKTEFMEEANTVCTNNDTAAEEAVDYLIQSGRKNIAIVLSNHPKSDNHDKLTGCKRALQKHGLTLPDSNILHADNTPENGYIAFSKLLDMPVRPDAVFIATDTMAFGAIEKLNQAGLTPDEVAVIGFDDLKVGAVIEPKLTTVTKPSYRMGMTAGRLLFDIIEEESTDDDPQTIVLQSRLKIRKSCGNKERLKEIW